MAAWQASAAFEADDAAYFVYGPQQDPVQMRPRYLRDALAVSEGIEAAVYLLNPKVRTTDGEWEAWFFGNELPGANRYPSFQALMMAERPRTLRELRLGLAYR